jgi:hypothetical protein
VKDIERERIHSTKVCPGDLSSALGEDRRCNRAVERAAPPAAVPVCKEILRGPLELSGDIFRVAPEHQGTLTRRWRPLTAEGCHPIIDALLATKPTADHRVIGLCTGAAGLGRGVLMPIWLALPSRIC